MRGWICWLVLFWASPALACDLFHTPIQDVKGNAIVGASVTVYLAGTSTPATVYADQTCTTTLANPLTTGTDGTVTGFLADGLYTVTPSKAGYDFDNVSYLHMYGPSVIVEPTYGTTVTINLALGRHFLITATNATDFTIINPTNTASATGMLFAVTVKNASGGALGTITSDTLYKVGATVTSAKPANLTQRTFHFYWNGTYAIEIGRTAADVTF